MSNNFDRCVAVTLAYEGGFVDNPADPGGATNFGITLRTLEAFLGEPVTVDDVRNMTVDTATAIYGANYWNAMRCSALPPGVDMALFDFGVNSGIGRAVRTLQRIVSVAQDGSVGPATIGAVQEWRPADLVTSLCSARLAFLRGLPTFAEFGNGWTTRVKDVAGRALAMVAGAGPVVPAAPPSEPATSGPDNSADALMAQEQATLDEEPSS
jgi:lysozyme family protein